MKTDETKLIHIPHIEDLVFQEGRVGVRLIRKIFSDLMDSLVRGEIPSALTMKWDGSPSIVIHKSDSDYWVATKAAFNKNPKLNRSLKDIVINHGHSSGLVEYLKNALLYCQELPISGTFQGDFLYIFDDLYIDPEWVSFKPNVIRYAVSRKSPDGKAIIGSKMGLVLHSKYDANMRLECVGNFRVDGISTKNVYVRDAKPNIKLPPYPPEYFSLMMGDLQHASSLLYGDFIDSLYTSPIYKELDAYSNHMGRSGLTPSARDFLRFIEGRSNDKIASLKMQNAKDRKILEKDRLSKHIVNHLDEYGSLFTYIDKVREIKGHIISILDKCNQTRMYIEEGTNLTPIGGEGYVYSETIPVKLVDRSKFSLMNSRGVI